MLEEREDDLEVGERDSRLIAGTAREVLGIRRLRVANP